MSNPLLLILQYIPLLQVPFRLIDTPGLFDTNRQGADIEREMLVQKDPGCEFLK